MTAALELRTARDVLEKARRERERYANALGDRDRVAAADHLFNLAVTILAVRDWIGKTAPQHKLDARKYVRREPAIARLVDAANIGKHRVLDDPPKSDPEIVEQRFTADAPPLYAPDPLSVFGVVPRILRSKATLADGTRFFHLDDADAAIAAWERFMESRGL